MAFTSTNTIQTSKLAELVALQIAVKAGFMKIGSKDYFSDQINGKMRSGQTYSFVIPDAGNVVEGLVASPRAITENKVDLSITNFNNSVSTNVIEDVTDIKWEDEIAKPFASKLVNSMLAKEVSLASTKACAAFIGSGFAPLAEAGSYIQSITNEDVYGWVDPQVQAILASNGQQFVPNGAPDDLYSKGHLGVFQGVDYAAERFLKPVMVDSNFVNGTSAAKFTAYTNDGTASNLSINGLTGSFTIPQYTPFFVNGVYACDTVGSETNAPYAFIAQSAVSVTGASASIPVNPVITADIGSRMAVGISGAAGNSVSTLNAAGSWKRALVRADGAYCYTPVETMEFKLSNSENGEVDGIKIYQNSFTDGISAINTTRFDAPYLAGVVEPRAEAVAYIKG